MSKILAVDDSPSMREMVALTLRAAGHEVVTAQDGTDALEFAKGEAVNLVITDIHMPEMDGISLVKELRALDSYRLVPILVLTTESSSDMKQRGKQAGATGWIVKPFDPSRLLGTIQRVLD